MKAIVLEGYGGVEVMKLRSVLDPVPGREDLLVQVMATAVNRADVMQRRGLYPQPGKAPEHEIPGLEYAGVVLAVGTEVQGFKPGDRVMGLVSGGSYAERLVVHERLAVRVPDQLAWTEAAAIPEAFMTAYDALFLQGGLRLRQRVLIHAGGSGVGTAAILLAKLAGAQVFTTVGGAEKAGRLTELGADRVTLYREEDFREVVMQETAGEGVHLVLDFVGGPYLQRNLEALARKGRLIILGTLGGREPAELPIRLVMSKWLTVSGSTIRSRPLEEKAHLAQAFAAEVLPAFRDGRLGAVVDSVCPLERVAEAHDRMEANANFGKIVLTVGE